MGSDAIRLAAVVLAARTPAATGRVEIRTGELGRWLGLSESYVASIVVPGLRRSGIVEITTAVGPRGESRGLECKVLPMWDAQTVPGHALALHRKELATLLRLLEGLFAPGWSHRDGSVTPAGLLGTRTGRGAATDRLALLLLALEATKTGRVRMCAGAINSKRGRAAATLARLLGCTHSAGERILSRLTAAGVVERVRVRTTSGLAQRSRLIVPAVAHAHDVGGRIEQIGPSSAHDAAAGPDQGAASLAIVQVSGAKAVASPAIADPDVAPALHAYHPPVAAVEDESSGGLFFSGKAVVGKGRLPNRAGACEDQIQASQYPARLLRVAPEGSPLLCDEKIQLARSDDFKGRNRQLPTPPPSAAKSRQQHGRIPRPPDDLLLVLASVQPLWQRLERAGARHLVLAAVRSELAGIAGLTGQQSAAGILADRLTWRLAEQGGPDAISDVVGWMLRRGLPRRGCTDIRCDGGVRIDNGSPCGLCDLHVATRRQERRNITAAVRAEDRHLNGNEVRAATEARFKQATFLAIAERQAHHRAFTETHTPRGECSECGGRIMLAGEALTSGLCKPCRSDAGTFGRAATKHSSTAHRLPAT
ncbi:hypothetical protein [Streptomyces goshikiensis]